jgi:predicted permease
VLRVLMEVLLPVALVAAVGYALRTRMPLDQTTLNRVVIYGMSPALIFTSLVAADLSGGGALRMLALSVGGALVMGAIAAVIAWPLGIRGGSLSALLLVSMFMNSGNYGLPAARFAFGEDGFALALFYFVAQSIMGQTLGVAVAAAGQAREEAGLAREVARRVLRMPQIYAVAAALLARWAGFDPAAGGGAMLGLFRGLSLLGEATLPMMLVVLGVQLAGGVVREEPRLVALACALRLVVSPLVAYGLGRALGMDQLSFAVGVMLAGMPAAVHTTITAIEFDSRPSLVVATVVATSLLSLLSLSAVLTLMGYGGA